MSTEAAARVASKADLAKKYAENEAKRLETKIKSYNDANKKNGSSNMSELSQIDTGSNSGKNNGMKDKLKKKAVTKTLEVAAGVPEEVGSKLYDFAQSEQGQKILKRMNKQNFGPVAGGLMNKMLYGKKETEEKEEEKESIFGNTKLTMKIVKSIAIYGAPILVVFVFVGLFIAASQVYLNSVGIGQADEVSADDADEKIDDTEEDDLNEEIGDETAYAESVTISRKKYAVSYTLTTSTKKAKNETTVREDTEVDLSELEDYYGTNIDKKTVNSFFYKLHDIQKRYKKKLGVSLDLPLLMSTLMLQSKDMSEVFKANTIEQYDRTDIESVDTHILDYSHDWTGYKITRDNSAHDMEILAQNMVSQDSNGKYVIDYDKYDEFLQEFLEKKYLIEGGGEYNKTPSVTPEITKDGNYVGGVEYTNSNFGNIIYYNQGDYKNYYYSSNPSKPQYYRSNKKPATISSHGCGPTSLAIIVSSMLNKQITPIETTSKVCLKKGCTSDGSYYSQLVTVGSDYGLNATTTKKDQDVINALGSGNSLVIVLMGPGTFTKGGHYIVLTGVNDKGQVSVADPASRKRTETKWFSFNTIVEQRKKYAPYMIFSR